MTTSRVPTRVPCTIVTGFLGAGKTTLIRHVLANAGGRRLAVLVNEFGDVGIDGEILKGCGDAACPEENIVELANGCLCCTVADEFVPALDTILSRRPAVEHIVIETSGLALPKPLVQAFHWPSIRSRVTVDGVVAVVDGAALAEGRVAADLDALARQRGADTALDHDDPIEEVFEDQIACADLVVLNKRDLIDAGGLDAAVAAIARALPRAVKVFPEFRRGREWKLGTLGTIADISSGSTPARSVPAFYEGGTIPWVKTTDLNNSVVGTTEESVTPAAGTTVNPARSVLVAMYGGFRQIGRTGILGMPAATNQALSVLVVRPDTVLPEFVLMWLNAKVGEWRRVAGSSRKDPNITGSDVASFPIASPVEEAEQRRISDCLSTLDDLLAGHARNQDALKQHRFALLQQLFPHLLGEAR